MVSLFDSVRKLLNDLPQSWVELTTHRLDIYNESQAKSEFLAELKKLLAKGNYSTESLEQLPTAYDYIRLGHQLSSVLEWLLAEINQLSDEQIITFASKTMPLLALLRKNKLAGQMTNIYYDTDVSPLLDEERLKRVYGYSFNLQKINALTEIPQTDGMSVFVTQRPFDKAIKACDDCDISINIHADFGSVMLIHNTRIPNIINDVQHVRRRETIAISPNNALALLKLIVKKADDPNADPATHEISADNRQTVINCIQENTGSELKPLIASSGLSIQYAMMMGLVENALNRYPNKAIKIILPPNCYGGTNDQSRRIAELIANVDIVDMLVDGGQDLVSSLDEALSSVAKEDAVALVLAEIPTNPRVEVPDMQELAEVLARTRVTANKQTAIQPYFMVDQTFCPNVKLLHQQSELHQVQTISFASGSKFPSGGRCVAGYCAANNVAKELLELISHHLLLSDNLANAQQLRTLATNMPSMPTRIKQAYEKTRELVNFIQNLLPQAKIYYVSDEIAHQGFMPSVFSLDLPTRGNTPQQCNEKQKRLNTKLIEFMINAHPQECKNCVSYGQLKGSYWTIPATSTQGTTKEEDKDYVVRVALSPMTDVKLLTRSFAEFVRLFILN